MRHPSARSLYGLGLAVVLLAPSLRTARLTHAQPVRIPARITAGPVGRPLIKTPGATGEVVITVPGAIPPTLLSARSLAALAQENNNYDANGDIVSIPVLILGSKATPAILDVFNAIARFNPTDIILVGVPNGSSLTIINYAVATGAEVYSNAKPGRITTLTALNKAINDDALYQVPVSIAHSTGSKFGETNGNYQPIDVPDVALPRSVDNSGDLPPIADQGDLNDCVAWSTSYYYMTALEGQVHSDWDLSTTDHQFSPAFVYNQVDGGKDDGAYIPDAMQLLQDKGDVPLSLVPEDNHDFTAQPPDAAVAAASAYRIDHFGYLLNNESDPPYQNDITPLKKWLAGGNEFVVGLQVFDSLQNYKGGVYAGPYPGDPSSPDGHAMIVVGYDDNAEKTGLGAFLIANSWGADYGEQGYVWISYDYFRKYATDAWAMVLPSSSGAGMASVPPAQAGMSVGHAAIGAPQLVTAVRYQPSGVYREPAGSRAAAASGITYYSDSSYKLARNPARHDFIATITYTYERDDAAGNAIEQRTYRVRVEAQQDNDEVVSQRYRMSDGAIVTGQANVDTGGQTY